MHPPFERPTVHYTELRDMGPDSALDNEWHTYLAELPRWLAEGKEGKFVLIKGTEVIGIFDNFDAADAVWCQRFAITGALIHQIREREPIYRTQAV
jgi:hypothetical protein